MKTNRTPNLFKLAKKLYSTENLDNKLKSYILQKYITDNLDNYLINYTLQ